MAKRPETRGFLLGVIVQGWLGAILIGVGAFAVRDRFLILGFGFAAGGAVLLVFSGRGLYRWRVRRKNGEIGLTGKHG